MNTNCSACSTTGVYAVERTWRADAAAWTWNVSLLSGDDLEAAMSSDLTWGSAGDGDETMTDLYVASGGGGVWDGILWW